MVYANYLDAEPEPMAPQDCSPSRKAVALGGESIGRVSTSFCGILNAVAWTNLKHRGTKCPMLLFGNLTGTQVYFLAAISLCSTGARPFW